MTPLLIALLAAGLAFALTPVARHLGRTRGVVDVPNERSLHSVPTPRTGGHAILTALAIAFTVGGVFADFDLMVIAFVAVVLAVLAMVDERVELPRTLRFVVQLLALGSLVVWGHLAPDTLRVPTVGLIPLGMLAVPLAVLWVLWLTNAYNFMDGANGMASVEAFIAGTTFAILFAERGDVPAALMSAAIAGAAAGFLPWNFPRASIFMGDTGSATIGFLFGALALRLAANGGLLRAALPLLPFLFDATVTIVRRAVTGEPFWRPHRSHFYQRMVALGASHTAVTFTWGTLALASSIVAVWWTEFTPPGRLGAIVGLLVVHLGVVAFVVRREGRRRIESPRDAHEARH